MRKIKYPEIGKRIANARKKTGKTQKEVREDLGDATLSMISDWENGYAFPSVEYLKKISDLYKVSIDYLIRGDEQHDSPRKKITVENTIQAVLWLINSCNFNWHIENKDKNYYQFKPGEKPYKFRLSTHNSKLLEFFATYLRLKENEDIMTENAFNESLSSLLNKFSTMEFTSDDDERRSNWD